MFTPDSLPGLVFAGSTKLGAAATTTSVLTIAAFDELLVMYRITGYGAADIGAFRFGGTAGAVDTAANYWDRNLSSAQNTATFTNTQTASSTMVRVAQATATTQRNGLLVVSNNATTSKMVGHLNSLLTNTAAPATVGALQIGGGEWVNTTQQIIALQMLTAGGQTLSAGTGFAVWGFNY